MSIPARSSPPSVLPGPQTVKPERVAREVRPYARTHTKIKSTVHLVYPFMLEELTANDAG